MRGPGGAKGAAMGNKSRKRARQSMEHKHGKDRAFRVHKALRAPLEQIGIRRCDPLPPPRRVGRMAPGCKAATAADHA